MNVPGGEIRPTVQCFFEFIQVNMLTMERGGRIHKLRLAEEAQGTRNSA